MTTDMHTSETTRSTAAAPRVAVVAAAASLTLLAVLHVLKPELDPSWHYISEYAIGRHGWIMRGYFVLLAAGLAAVLVAMGSYARTTAVVVGLVLGPGWFGLWSTFRAEHLPMHLGNQHRGDPQVDTGWCLEAAQMRNGAVCGLRQSRAHPASVTQAQALPVGVGDL